MLCPLCEHSSRSFFEDSYLQCTNCELIFKVDKPSIDNERSHYDSHENDPEDNRYIEFLENVLTPLKKYLKSNDVGLDFGSGPGPAIAPYFEKLGFSMTNFDPFFGPKEVEGEFNFITSTEVWEHFHYPGESISKCLSHLKSEGYIGIMSTWWDETIDFKNWYYRRDVTHVVFYTMRTLNYIAGNFGLKLIESGKNWVVFQKI